MEGIAELTIEVCDSTMQETRRTFMTPNDFQTDFYISYGLGF